MCIVNFSVAICDMFHKVKRRDLFILSPLMLEFADVLMVDVVDDYIV